MMQHHAVQAYKGNQSNVPRAFNFYTQLKRVLSKLQLGPLYYRQNNIPKLDRIMLNARGGTKW
jgi:hypothetical protein